jgi:PAS domain S-box-containing protein
MALLTQNHNWTTTPVGAIETWPQSLRTALSIVLQSAFPMLLFWGKDLIAFYNDPYTKILQTDNRHPALGKKAVDIWPEGWETVKPLLEKVYYEGETVHFEDMLIPVLRKGQMEDVYWTFKYSPFYGDNEEIAGVIVSCAETTEKVNNYKRLQEQKEELEFAIEATELGTWDVDPIHNTLKTNKRLKEWFGLAPDDQVSLSSATDNIIEPDRQRVLEAINNALQYESGGQYDIEYTIINPVTKTERIVRAKGRSWFNEDKIAYRFNGTLQDVTQQVIARKKVEQSEQRFRNLVEEAIVSTAILTGPDMVLELANEAMLNIWGRNRSVIGKPLLEIMPELKGQPFPKILAEVYDAGKEFVAEGALVQLEKNGKLEDVYMDFSYKPLKEEDNNITGILVMATDVTERVLTNRRLQQSEENLRNTILKAPVAMAIFKGEKFVTEIANEKMLELWGKKAEEVLDKPTFEAMPEVKEQGFDTILKEVYTTGRSYADQGIPLKLMREGKMDVVFLNFVFEAYRGPDGSITGIIVVAIDVTDQVVARQKLEKSEQRVRALVESAPFPIAAYTGKEMRIELANQSILDIWGKGNNVIGKLYSDVLPELENQEVFEQLEMVYTSGRPFHARNQRLDLLVDGKLRPYYFNYSFTPLYDSEGQVYGVMNTGADVTDLNLAKHKVEQSEKNFRNMILQAPVAMCIMMGPEHVVDIANDFMIELWGKNREDVMDKPIWQAVPDAKDQGLEQLIEHVYSHGETFTAFERPVELLRNGKKDVVYQNFVYQPYRDSNGNVLGVLAISIDVTAQVLARHKIEDLIKERTNELETANKNLEQSNAALEQFAYITSHDLQEPVRKISIFSKMLESSFTELDEKQSGYITKIKSAAERMSNLIKDVLLYSKVSKGGDTFEEVDLSQIISDTVNDYELLIEQSNASVQYNSLPVVDAIPLQMVQLFSNLLSNSLKYIAPGVKPEILITSSLLPKDQYGRFIGLNPDKAYHNIEFKDNGIGFEPEYAEKIFSIFQRLHTKSEYTGTGVGLAICRKIMENHRGDIKAAPRPEGGAVFNIIIPVK